MRLALFTDNHWCQYSSIVRGRGTRYSTRLENQIASLKWVEETAKLYYCDRIICLGDFFDKASLNAEELSALNEVYRNISIPHAFIVGNHEAMDSNLIYSSVGVMGCANLATVISTPLKTVLDGTEVCYLPYQLECDRKPIGDIFGDCNGRRRIILSHNDIAGVQYGNVVSKFGYDVNEIEKSCDLFINGHIHNGEKIGEKIINLGNLTGQNFSEDALHYTHRMMIIDTSSLDYKFVDNPYALNFYKLEFGKSMPNIKPNAVVSLKVKEEDLDNAKEWLSNANIIASRIVVDIGKTAVSTATDSGSVEGINHLLKFREFVHANIGCSSIIDEELELVGAIDNEH